MVHLLDTYYGMLCLESYLRYHCPTEASNHPSVLKDGSRTRLKGSKILRENKLYAKFSKCEFLFRHVSFLRHMMSKHGISVDPTKIEVAIKWDHTNTVIEVCMYTICREVLHIKFYPNWSWDQHHEMMFYEMIETFGFSIEILAFKEIQNKQRTKS